MVPSNLSIPEMCSEVIALLAQLERDDLMHRSLWHLVLPKYEMMCS